MTKPLIETPNLDELEKGPWPSFVTGLKRLAKESDMMADLLGQLETSYKTKKGYWKGGTVGVFGYGGGIIPRFTELKDENGKPMGKRSPAHDASVVGDTVGDPFKDTAGPSLHVVIKLLSTITLVMAPLFLALHH